MRNYLYPKLGEPCVIFDSPKNRTILFEGHEYIELPNQEELSIEEYILNQPALIQRTRDIPSTNKYKLNQVNKGDISLRFYQKENEVLDINRVFNTLEVFYLM